MNNTLDGRTVLVTGANGGLGSEFVRQALERGARKVYAAARSPQHWDDPRVDALTLDITDAASVAHAVEAAPDVDLVVNNAGIAPGRLHFGPRGSTAPHIRDQLLRESPCRERLCAGAR